ncbi:MAG: histidine phosphatase family protein [Actinomycetes bacterium]
MPPEISTIYLIRHAHSTANATGVLAGQDRSVHLSELGVKQAQLLTSALSGKKFAKVLSSPMPRCKETISGYLKLAKKSVVVEPGINEMDYGSWSGRKLKVLSKLKLWKVIQSRPSLVRFPGGESFIEMSARANQVISDNRKVGGTICLVAHGDVIKAIVASQLGLSLDHLQQFVIDPASITVIRISDSGSMLVKLNDTSHLAVLSKRVSSKTSSTGFVLGGGEGRV